MKITWIGYSCFKVEDNGYTVIFDSYGDNTGSGLPYVVTKISTVFKKIETMHSRLVFNTRISRFFQRSKKDIHKLMEYGWNR